MIYKVKTVLKNTIGHWINKPFVKGKSKVFCISRQRTGTTSVGKFLNEHGIRTAGHPESAYSGWSYFWLIGDYESIFKDNGFKSYQGFQDGPWWFTDFYKVLNHKFPDAKFILFKRNSDEWYDSMLKHSNGKTLGNTYIHCKLYNRLNEYFKISDDQIFLNPFDRNIDNLLDLGEKNRVKYKKIFESYNKEAIEYFSHFGKDKLFVSDLSDQDKWKNLGKFLDLDIDIEDSYEAHSNKSHSQ